MHKKCTIEVITKVVTSQSQVSNSQARTQSVVDFNEYIGLKEQFDLHQNKRYQTSSGETYV